MDWLDDLTEPRCSDCSTVMRLEAGAFKCGCGAELPLPTHAHPGVGEGLLEFRTSVGGRL